MATAPRRSERASTPQLTARDYYGAMAHAVAKLERNTAAARLELFERAKSMVVQEMRARRPPAAEPEIVRECAALRAAIRQVEDRLSSARSERWRMPDVDSDADVDVDVDADEDQPKQRRMLTALDKLNAAAEEWDFSGIALVTVGALAFVGVVSFLVL